MLKSTTLSWARLVICFRVGAWASLFALKSGKRSGWPGSWFCQVMTLSSRVIGSVTGVIWSASRRIWW